MENNRLSQLGARRAIHRGVLITLALCLLACLPLSAAPPASAPAAAQTQPKPLLDFRQTILDNGLRVVTVEDFASPVVAVQMWYHVGSKDEKPDRQGFAHMFEHMMFRGTDRLGPTDHFDLLRRAGGACNGSTGFDRTLYNETLPASQLELALWLEAERMAFLKIDQDSFDTERKVVEEERRLYLGGPYGSLYEKGVAEIFHKHPYRWTPIGRIPDLRQSQVGELRDFWMRYYGPSNATLVIVGAVRHADLLALAKKGFGWIPRGEDPPRVTVREPMPTAARSITISQDNAPMPLVGLVWRTVPVGHKDTPALELLASVLGDGHSSRLYRAMVADGRLAVGAEAEDETMEQDGVFMLGAALMPVGGDLANARAALEAEVAKVRTEKVTPRELLKARNNFLSRKVAGTLNAEGKGMMLGRAATYEGDPARANTVLDDVRRVTEDDLLRVARQYLDPNRVLAVTVPQNVLGTLGGLLRGASKGEEDSPVTVVREANAPPPGRPGAKRPADWPAQPPFATPAAPKIALDHVRHTLPSGMNVIIVSDHRAPLVNVSLHLRGGAWAESKPGACSMAMSMLTKGTAAHTEAQLADELETYAISLSGSGGMDSSHVGASCLSEHMDLAMGLLSEVVLTPALPPEEFEKLRKQVRAGLANAEGSPGYLADREFRRRLFGNHPYARNESGEAADVDALKVEDAREWWNTFARPNQATLIFSGDVSEAHAMELAQKAFGAWKAGGAAPAVTLPAIPPPAATRIYLIDRPGTQSQIRVGQLGLTRKDPLYITSRVVDGYFGRGFGSRLNRTLRVEKGLTYGIGGGFAPQRLAGRYGVGTFSKTDSTPAALRAILDELKRLREVPPTEAELADTRAFMLGSFPVSHETPAAVAGDLWLLESEGLPSDWFNRMLAKVATVSADECTNLVRKTIDDSRLVIVVVGDADKLKKPLEAIAPVTVVESGKSPASRPASAPATRVAGMNAEERR